MYTSVADSKATFKAEHPEMAPFLDDICLEKATNAFNNSYSRPDLVGLNTQMEYAQRLVSEVTSVREAVNSAIDRGATVIGDWEAEIDLWFAGFREGGLKQKFYDYLSAESRCASSFICGPANFPTARNQKRQATARVRREEISEYCNKAVKGDPCDHPPPWGRGWRFDLMILMPSPSCKLRSSTLKNAGSI